MKRVIIAVLFVSVVLCGCSDVGGSAKDDRKFMASAIGFEDTENGIKVCLEVIIVNSENFSSDPVSTVFSGEGKSINEALRKIGDRLPKKVLFDHCGIICVAENIDKKQFAQISDYCFREDKITLSAYMVSTENCEKLLTGESKSSISVGYDIMGIIEQESAQTGIAYNSRYFEIESLRENKKNIFTIPHFSRDEKGIKVDGMRVFYKDGQMKTLETDKAEMFSIITGATRSGEVNIGEEKYKLNRRTVDCKYKNGRSSVTLNLEISGKNNDKKRREHLEKELEDFEKSLFDELKVDVFGFEDILKKEIKNYKGDGGKIIFSVKCWSAKGTDNDEE